MANTWNTWTEMFARVLAETDSDRLPLRIDETRAAIMERVNELVDDPDRQPEHDQILHALNRLSAIESELCHRAKSGMSDRTGLMS